MSITEQSRVVAELRRYRKDTDAAEVRHAKALERDWRKQAAGIVKSLRKVDGDTHAEIVEDYLGRLEEDIASGAYGSHVEAVRNNIAAVHENLTNTLEHERQSAAAE